MTDKREPTFLGATISRRSMLTRSGLVGGLALIGCSPSDERRVPDESSVLAPQRRPTPPADLHLEEGYVFFTAEEARTIEAIVSRIIPGDDNDPGALQAGVPVYIDRKLNDFEAFAEPTYHEGPFAQEYQGDTAPETSPDSVAIPAAEIGRYGFQSPLTPQEHYRLGLAGVDRYAQTRFGSLFADLAADLQDQVLTVMDDVQQRTGDDAGGGDSADTVTADEGQAGGGTGSSAAEMDQAETVFGDLDPGEFFNTLRIDTIEGMFSDPVYGGNRNLVGWTLIGWPGPQRSYSPDEMLHGTDKGPSPLESLPPMNPDRIGGGREALEKPRDGVHSH